MDTRRKGSRQESFILRTGVCSLSRPQSVELLKRQKQLLMHNTYDDRTNRPSTSAPFGRETKTVRIDESTGSANSLFNDIRSSPVPPPLTDSNRELRRR